MNTFRLAQMLWANMRADFWQDNAPELDFESNNRVWVGGENNYPLSLRRHG